MNDIPSKRPLAWSFLIAMRPAQWTKNALVFAAFLFALGDQHQDIHPADGWIVLIAALLFCLASSGVYLINDIRDAAKDRLHPTKKLRPIATGELNPSTAAIGAVVLIAGSLLGSAWIDRLLAAVVGGYLALQMVYTFLLKDVALVDVFVIAGGFVLRAIAGGVAIGVMISPWLLLCTLLLALFLGLCKRRHEKVVLNDVSGGTRSSLQHYHEGLLDQLIAIVSAATIVCYALYTLWPETVEKFGTSALGFTIPFVIFGLFRYLDLVYRHEQGGHPERTLLTDPPLLIDMALYGAVVLAIIFLR